MKATHFDHPETEIDLGDARRIGVISDTHIPHRLMHLPPQVLAVMDGVDAILHAGDVEDGALAHQGKDERVAGAPRGRDEWSYVFY